MYISKLHHDQFFFFFPDQSMSVLSHLSWMNQFSLKTEQVVVLLEAKQTEQSPGIMTSLTSINMEVTFHQNDIGKYWQFKKCFFFFFF